MKKFFNQQTLLLMLLLCLFILKVNGQGKFEKTSSQSSEIKKLKAKVEADPSNLKLHETFIDVYNVGAPAIINQTLSTQN